MKLPWGSIAGAGMKVGGMIYGGMKASDAIGNIKDNIRQQMRDNQNWYDRNYNADTTQRTDTRRIITMMKGERARRNRAAEGAQAVMGGTDEAVAAARAANNEAMADATSRIAVAGEARKDAIEDQYLRTKADLNNQLNNAEYQKAAEIAKAVGGVSDAAQGVTKLF